MRRTWCLRPSWMVSSIRLEDTRRTFAGAVRPSSSSTPSRSDRSAGSLIGAFAIRARYVRGTSNDGCVSRCARSPSLVSRIRPGRLVVEPADGVQPLAARHQRDDGRPPLRVLRRGHHARRLVDGVDDARVAGRPHPLAVDLDRARVVDVARRVGDDGAVDGHAPVGDDRLGGAPRGDSGVGEVFRESQSACHDRCRGPGPARTHACEPSPRSARGRSGAGRRTARRATRR